MHARAVRAVSGRLGTAKEALADDRVGDGRQHRQRARGVAARRHARVGATRSGHRARRARRRRRRAAVPHHRRDRVVRAGAHGRRPRSRARPTSPTASSSAGGARSTLEPPRRPEPDRISASVSGRTEDWKYGFVGSRDREQRRAAHAAAAGARASATRSTTWRPRRCPTCRARSRCSPSTASPTRRARPIAFAVVDWDGGGRLPGRAHRRRRRPRCRWATASR